MKYKFKKSKNQPIRKKLNIFNNITTTGAATIGFRSGIKHHLKKENISVEYLDQTAIKTYKKPFMALTEKQMENTIKKVRK